MKNLIKSTFFSFPVSFPLFQIKIITCLSRSSYLIYDAIIHCLTAYTIFGLIDPTDNYNYIIVFARRLLIRVVPTASIRSFLIINFFIIAFQFVKKFTNFTFFFIVFTVKHNFFPINFLSFNKK